MTTTTFVDLRSDTVTRPTPAMREAMAAAEVGDDVFGEDPAVNALQERAAKMLGKERALYVPSGTMANLCAILAQTRPGETVILNENAHPYRYEGGNIAVVGGVLTRTIPAELGVMSADDIAPYIVRSTDHHYSPTTLIAIENTTNVGGGNMYSVEGIAAIRKLADAHGIRIHCDGARLFNAVVASNTTAAELVKDANTVSICFSKGLGAPVGSLVAGPAKTIDEAHRFRKLLGGGMRQAGVIAAAALYALDHHVDRLAEDHRRARQFREALEGTPGIAFPLPNPTNIVYVDVPDVMRFIGEVGSRGVLVLPTGPRRIRAVFHLDIDDTALDRAVTAFRQAAQALAA